MEGYVYFIQVEGENKFKIGMTRGSPYRRMRNMQTGSPINLVMYAYIPTDRPKELERELHQELVNFRERGEWFGLTETQVKETLARHKDARIKPTFIELVWSPGARTFYYEIATGKVFVALETIEKIMGRFYFLAYTTSPITIIDGNPAIDYDVLIEDFPKYAAKLIEDKKRLLAEGAKFSATD